MSLARRLASRVTKSRLGMMRRAITSAYGFTKEGRLGRLGGLWESRTQPRRQKERARTNLMAAPQTPQFKLPTHRKRSNPLLKRKRQTTLTRPESQRHSTAPYNS